MFEAVESAPADPILGLKAVVQSDPNPDKIDLSVGVYKDASGVTPTLECVERAEAMVLERHESKSYVDIAGSPHLPAYVQGLLFGLDHEIVASERVKTAQAPGGTGALRVAGDVIKKLFPKARVWLSDPTWANHASIFGAAGVEVASYPYYDAAAKRLAFDEMTDALAQVPPGDFVLLHACCHNPTGMDPTPEQWRVISDLAGENGFLPLVDFAYQGFGDGLQEDANGLRLLAQPGRELLVASSYSKNFGLYKERIGALTLVAGTADSAGKAFSHVKKCIRANYSNPPAHGADIVTTVLNDPELRDLWTREVAAMRDRINRMRHLFVETLAAKGVKEDFGFIARQRGMFSFSGLNRDQVELLREKHSIYIVNSGRINVAGMTEANMGRLCEAIADVLGSA